MNETTKEFRTEVLPAMRELARRVATDEKDGPLHERLNGLLWAHHDQLLALAQFGAEWCENSALEKWFPLTAEELDRANAQAVRLKNELSAMTAAKAAAEGEADAFMEYHEGEMMNVYAIRQVHGTAVVAIQVDRMQFLHATPERLEELVKLLTVQTMEALLAGTPGREVFAKLTQELVRQRVAAQGGAA